MKLTLIKKNNYGLNYLANNVESPMLDIFFNKFKTFNLSVFLTGSCAYCDGSFSDLDIAVLANIADIEEFTKHFDIVLASRDIQIEKYANSDFMPLNGIYNSLARYHVYVNGVSKLVKFQFLLMSKSVFDLWKRTTQYLIDNDDFYEILNSKIKSHRRYLFMELAYHMQQGFTINKAELIDRVSYETLETSHF